MFCMLKKKKIYPAYISKHNSNCDMKTIFLMIANREVWHCFAGKKTISKIKKNNV